MKVKKIVVAGAILSLVSMFLAGCGGKSASTTDSKNGSGKKANENSVIRISERDIIPTMDSSLATDVISNQNISNTMEGLYRYDKKQVKPAISTKVVKPTDNGLKYTFPLRKDAKWSNGDPVTADDFVFAWRRTVNPETKSQYAYIYEGIKNAKEIIAGTKPVDSLGVRSVDKYTLEVTLDTPIPYFDQLVTAGFFYPQNQKNVEKWGKDYGTSSKTLVFNGPYKLVNWKGSDNSWVEEKNDDYWDAKNVQVKKLEYQVVKDSNTTLNLYQNGKLDRAQLTGDTAKQMKGSEGYGVTKKTSSAMLVPNVKKVDIFKNAKIRQAMSLSINRKQLTDKVLGDGSVANDTIIPAGMSFDPTDKSKDFVKQTNKSAEKYGRYDLKEAKRLWEEGLKETGNIGKTFNLVLLGDDFDGAKKQAEYLQNQLEQLPGLKLTVNNIPFKARLARAKNGDFDILISGWTADFPDPINYLTLFMTDSSYNDGKWSNTKFDDLVIKSMTKDANDLSLRWKDMIDAQDIMNEEQGAIPLYQRGEVWMTNKRIKNFEINPSGHYDMNLVEVKD